MTPNRPPPPLDKPPPWWLWVAVVFLALLLLAMRESPARGEGRSNSWHLAEPSPPFFCWGYCVGSGEVKTCRVICGDYIEVNDACLSSELSSVAIASIGLK